MTPFYVSVTLRWYSVSFVNVCMNQNWNNTNADLLHLHIANLFMCWCSFWRYYMVDLYFKWEIYFTVTISLFDTVGEIGLLSENMSTSESWPEDLSGFTKRGTLISSSDLTSMFGCIWDKHPRLWFYSLPGNTERKSWPAYSDTTQRREKIQTWNEIQHAQTITPDTVKEQQIWKEDNALFITEFKCLHFYKLQAESLTLHLGCSHGNPLSVSYGKRLFFHSCF